MAACAVATIEFTSLYLTGTTFLNFSSLLASTGAFLVTDLGNFAWLPLRGRR